MGSRVDALHTEIIHFIEKQVDPEKLDRVKRWHRAPVASYGFDKADMEQIYNRFDDHFNALHLEDGIELAEKLIRLGNNTLIHLGIHLLSLRRNELGPPHFWVLDDLIDSFVRWGNVDHLCGSLVRPLLERYPPHVH